MDVRSLEAGDADALARLLGVLGYPAGPDRVRARIARLVAAADHDAWVAVSDGRVIGYAAVQLIATLEHDEPVARLIGLAVLPEHEGQGAGTALLGAVERRVAERGAHQVSLTSGTHRAGAHDFYRRRGYEHTGLRFRKHL